MKCYLDMDGVLVNFVKGACKAHRRQDPYIDPENHGMYDMAHLWGMSNTQFWDPFTEEWWESLEPTKEMETIVKRVVEKFGLKSVAVLSSPSSNEYAMPAKKRWLQKYVPDLAKRYSFSPAAMKEFAASPNHVLIDDYDKNVAQFDLAGGNSILFPRPWNRRYKDAANPLKILDRDLKKVRVH